jgi:hypothetical protein
LRNENIQSTQILSLTAMGFRDFGVQGSTPGVSDIIKKALMKQG